MLQVQSNNGCVTIELACPETGNSLSAALVDRLTTEIGNAAYSGDTHTLVIRGAGRHLCTGFDVSGLSAQTDGDLLLRFVRIEMMLQALWNAPVRTIAVGTGMTIGAGADLFAACDLRVAVSTAIFRFPGAQFGIVLGTRRLAERVGVDRARDWLLSGKDIDASAGLCSGLATHVVDSADLDGWLDQHAAKPSIDIKTIGALHRGMRRGNGSADLANLVRSCAQTGLRDRMEQYVRRQARRASVAQ